MDDTFDIVIAGGGPVGAALALGLRDSGRTLALIEARARETSPDDGRSIALSHGSRLILERLGVWRTLGAAVTPIRHISVTQQQGFGRVELNAADAGVPALGYVAAYSALQREMQAALDAVGVRVLAGRAVRAVSGDASGELAVIDAEQPLRARLCVIADGGGRLELAHVRTHDYHQSALVCDVVSAQSHQNRAFERFTPAGPLALLPAARGWSLVWTMRPEHALELAALDDATFCRRLQDAFGTALGGFQLSSARRVFPIVLRYATRPVAPRTVLIGNAAQMLHPVAGQGFNLGLRDAFELTRILIKREGDAGGRDILNAFLSQRRFDRIATILFTDSLIRLFCNDIPLLSSARGAGLIMMNAIPAAKKFLARRMMFGARGM